MTKSLIGENFSKSACSYDRHCCVQAECAQRLLDLTEGGDFRRILEIGCGTGNFTRLLRRKYLGAEITAVDISGQMIESAKKKLDGDKLRFFVADGEKLSIERAFDLVTANASLQWLDQPEVSFGRFARFLDDGGVISFSIYGPETFTELESVLSKRLGKGKWLSSRMFTSPDLIRRSVEKHFESVEFEEARFTVVFSSLIDLLRDIKRSGVRGYGLGGRAYLGRQLLAALEKDYLDKYGCIIASHQVFFCKGVKKLS